MSNYVKKDPNLPTLSVVTPAYNQADFLRDTIESVLSQDYPNIEHIVLDDGSTDATPEILKEYNGRVRWETHANMGQTATINKGWRVTTGEVVTWLNSDDTFYDPTSVRVGMEYLVANPDVGIVFGDSMFTEADGSEIERTRPIVDFTYLGFIKNCVNSISQPSAFIRRDVVEKAGELDPKFYYFMDWDFWMRAGIYCRIEHIDAVLSTYRLHADSKTVAQAKKAAPELEYMYKKYFDRDDVPAEIRAIEKEAMMNMCFTTGNYYLDGNDPELAAKMAEKAFEYNPNGKLRLTNLRKYLYCKFATHPIYRTTRAIYRGRRTVAG